MDKGAQKGAAPNCLTFETAVKSFSVSETSLSAFDSPDIATRIFGNGWKECSGEGEVPSLCPQLRDRAKTKLCEEGYFQIADGLGQKTRETLQRGVEALLENGWPPTFICLSDLIWDLYESFHSRWIAKGAKDQCAVNFDFLSWYVRPPCEGSDGPEKQTPAYRFAMTEGFSPHRDRQPDDAASSFFATETGSTHGVPKYLTIWGAVTDATPENSCLYVVPAPVDPGYWDGDIDEEGPFERIFKTKEKFQFVRCLPSPPGTCNVFSHRTLHWGSEGSRLPTMNNTERSVPSQTKKKKAEESEAQTVCRLQSAEGPPRIAVSFVFSEYDFEPPYVVLPPPGMGPALPEGEDTLARKVAMGVRIALAAGQMLCYQDRFLLSVEEARFFFHLFKKFETQFHPHYCDKVKKEFISAVQQRNHTAEKGDASSSSSTFAPSVQAGAKERERESFYDAAEDEALDVLLDVEMAGGEGGAVWDDFDDAGVDDDDDYGISVSKLQKKTKKTKKGKLKGERKVKGGGFSRKARRDPSLLLPALAPSLLGQMLSRPQFRSLNLLK
uniref:Uncharacterized protein n=1 Tax=Chromera velia CCMP2878 TaxID=1169474 RepID=A0A0G4FQM0_9ALVE|mmetsp:Transcript_52821/g.103280  ORF Transcript_52821/g.103280 Transcript_52821/m.103280 type:complete len:554 (-) Transcript_52821:209-1870(-)|eukprot:Cvel_18243.t1-p1 / transcript=Cvel_18243.t1 / gene=Cvel_18243 / organism=Chromera_velia_CCMP2878 / gene_product=hypothetical protein / transcript_product=hypothetical protein / location=Cvel_scaffold1500:41970-43628(-) / protein_length=553 / sequence_SO=supercontig / SO=protein_coding / is_pseudo=false